MGIQLELKGHHLPFSQIHFPELNSAVFYSCDIAGSIVKVTICHNYGSAWCSPRLEPRSTVSVCVFLCVCACVCVLEECRDDLRAPETWCDLKRRGDENRHCCSPTLFPSSIDLAQRLSREHVNRLHSCWETASPHSQAFGEHLEACYQYWPAAIIEIPPPPPLKRKGLLPAAHITSPHSPCNAPHRTICI